MASTYGQGPASLVSRHDPHALPANARARARGRHAIVIVSSRRRPPARGAAGRAAPSGTLGGISFVNVAHQVGLDFRQGAFRFGRLERRDGDDGRRALLAGLRQRRLARPLRRQLARGRRHRSLGGQRRPSPKRALPQRRREVRGRVGALRRRPPRSRRRLRGGRLQPRRSHRSLRDQRRVQRARRIPGTRSLWNNGDGTFTEGAVQAGINAQGWHSAAAVGDVNGDGRPDLFVSSYTDPNFVVDTASGFPSDHAPVRDLLYLNEGTDANGHSTFREVARPAGHREDEGRARPRSGVHGLQPRRTARPVRRERRGSEPALRERRAERAAPTPIPRTSASASRTSRNARASPTRTPAWESPPQDFSRDGRTDLFVTNSRDQLHAAYRSHRAAKRRVVRRRASRVRAAVGTHPAGGARRGPTSTSTATSTSCWRTARSPS